MFIFILVFVACDFEVGRNVSCEELTVSPVRGLSYLLLLIFAVLETCAQANSESDSDASDEEVSENVAEENHEDADADADAASAVENVPDHCSSAVTAV